MSRKDIANKMRAIAWRKIIAAHVLEDPFIHESALRLIDTADEIENDEIENG